MASTATPLNVFNKTLGIANFNMEPNLADGEVMGWVFEFDRGFSFLNEPGEYFGYVVLDLQQCMHV